MNRAHARLKAVANQLGWGPDVEVLAIAGYLVRSQPGLNPEAFTEATNTYAHKSGLPIDLIVKVLCGLIEESEAQLPKDAVSPFAEYIANVLSESRKLVDNEAAAQAMLLAIPAELSNDIDAVLKSERPLTDFEMGDAILRWNAKVDNEHELYLDVINAEPTPALSVTVTKNKKTIYRHRPMRFKQWTEMPTVELGRSLLLQWTGGSLSLTFLQK